MKRYGNTRVLIPAAGRVPEGILGISSKSCVAMIPVAGRPVIHWTLSHLQSLGLRSFTIAVPQRGLFIEDFLECTLDNSSEVAFVRPSREGGLGFTVLELVQTIPRGPVLVVLGDTHFSFVDPSLLAGDRPFILVSPVEGSYRWCVAESDENGALLALRDKEGDLKGPLDALIGVYFFPDSEVLRRACMAAVAEIKEDRSIQMADLLNRVHQESPIQVVQAGGWMDCGNPDRLASSQRSLLASRDFNHLEIDEVAGTLTKRSQKVSKFVDEINYYRQLPNDVSVFFPRLVDFSTDESDAFLTQEYYGYPSLAEMYVFENFDSSRWERIFDHLLEIVKNRLGRHTASLDQQDLESIYLHKTSNRLEALEESGASAGRLTQVDELEIDGEKMLGWPQLKLQLEDALSALCQVREGAIIHGDLCLSNILYDPRSGIGKFVDPRGSFGKSGIYGDPRYDVAKLYHSLMGGYDFIVNDLFAVREMEANRWAFSLRRRDEHREIQHRFEAVFLEDFDTFEVSLITGLLFLSMPALHYDQPARQVAMVLRGLQILNGCLTG